MHTICVPFLQLYNIVVDTEETGKDLLQKGKLKKRYTIIPLNKIAAKSISSDVIKKAQSLVTMLPLKHACVHTVCSFSREPSTYTFATINSY